ncbi:DNA_pol_B_2 domain-containing protein [Trichonephila clavata]|uniref:DNA-directed DNA polymerase n=1 Tax=Trichonephila clavata TaxID=2740835 RepID=A0A8X6LEU5_TRICU|nr:DNA_pol_B_2 domain-containing protein [Trichonephila clavata]
MESTLRATNGLDSAFRIIERCRRPNKNFNSEEVIFQVLLDADYWLNNRAITIGETNDAIRTLFETLLRRMTSSLEPTDLIRVIIFSEHLDRPISTHLMLVSEMSVEKIMACATKVLQSKTEVRLDEGFNIEIITIRRPVGSGKRNRRVIIPSIDRLRKTSIRCVPDDDLNICCAKAILLAIAEVEKDADLRYLRRKDCCILQKRAIALHQKTGVPQRPCGFEEIALFEQYLKAQVIAISTTALNQLYQCRKCCKVILRKACPRSQHQCGEKRCPSCKKVVAENHMCYLQKESAKKSNEKLIFFDFETDQSTGEHIVNFVVSQYLDGTEFVCEGYNAIDKFCKYLFSPQHKGFTAIAHNMKGFDGQFILRWMLEQGQCPRVIPNGSKIMCITLSALNIRIIDSFNFFPMSLSKLPKTFGLEELAKGYFPHLFNCPSNQSYVGSFPDSALFSPSTMSTGDREKFFLWYNGQKTNTFDFKKEMLKYCRSDVDILRRCCKIFREQF